MTFGVWIQSVTDGKDAVWGITWLSCIVLGRGCGIG